MKDFSIDGGFQGIHVEVRAAQSPEVYGVCLDCETGISVDNVAVRSAGMMNFSQMEVAALARQVRDLNVQLVILQFGINVVKNLSSSYKGYEENIYNNIMALKAAVPDASVLVVSLSDMARKEGTGMASYPNIAMIRDAQRNAAYRSGSAFWDLYEAMGGKNSMISWVNNNPPQAEKDYTHFNPPGARVVGKMIYDALMEEYYRHKGVIVEK
jgi:lysophospholipase L1-like esterase